MAQHIPTSHKGKNVIRDRSWRVQDALRRHCSVPNHWTIIFKIRQTKNTRYLLLCRTHGTGCHFYGFFIHTKKKLGMASDWRPSTDIYLQPSHLILRISLLYRNNPILNARSSLLIFHYVTFLIRLPTAINPSLCICIFVSLHLSSRFNLPMQLAWNCTAQRLLCVWWANISIEVDGMRIVVQRQAAVATSAADGSCNKNNIGIKFHKLHQEWILNKVFFFIFICLSYRAEPSFCYE